MQIDGNTGAEDVFTQQTVLVGLFQGLLESYRRLVPGRRCLHLR